MNSPYDLDDLDELDGADLTQRFNRSLSGLQFDPDALAAGAMERAGHCAAGAGWSRPWLEWPPRR